MEFDLNSCANHYANNLEPPHINAKYYKLFEPRRTCYNKEETEP